MHARAKSPESPEDGQGDEGGATRRPSGRLVAVGLVAALLVWFAVANRRDVPIDFWVHSARAPLIVVIVISGLSGAAITWGITRRKRPRD